VTTCILGVGNPIACDDGVGIRVALILRTLPLPRNIIVQLRATIAIDVLELLPEYDRIVIVDAMKTGAAAGTCRVLDVAEASALAATPYCCHAIGIAELLRIAHAAAPLRVAPRVVLVGIEAERLQEYGTELSPTVQNALPQAVRLVLELVEAEPDLVAMGVERASRGDAPAIAELLSPE
jgi:hydrogenase maturation protease